MSTREYRRLRWKLRRIEWSRKILKTMRQWQKVARHHEEQLEFRL